MSRLGLQRKWQIVLRVVCLLLIQITARSDASQASTSEETQEPPPFKTYWELVSWYSKGYDMDGLHQRLKSGFDSSERNLQPSKRGHPPPIRHRGVGFDATSRHKLVHDIEQFRWLAATDKLKMSEETQEVFEITLPRLYESVLERMDDTDFDEDAEFYEFQKEDEEIRRYYNRALFLPELGPDVMGGPGDQWPVPLLNPAVNFTKIERQWFGEEEGYEHPGIVVIDDLLSPQVLERVRYYLLMSTFYYEAKTPRFGRYVGAYLIDGMHDKLLMAIAFELNKAMPRVMKGHAMKEMWVYKYESSPDGTTNMTGIHTHADDAAVNVNMWITPDQANLDPASGGLVVFTAKPPDDWDFTAFNSNWEFVEENLLKPTNFANVTVPYRQNRAVLFDSFLFHKTDNCRFRKGYENRRINLTILYGNRKKPSDNIKEEL